MVNERAAVVESYPLHPFKRISWSAIFVGALVGVGLSFLLNLFSVAIGLSSFKLNDNGGMALAVGGFIGFLIAAIAAMLVAGYTAGYLGRFYCPQRNLGIVYGFTTWTLALVMSAIITAHVGNYVTNYTNNLSHAVVVVPKETTNSDSKAVTVEPTSVAKNEQKTVKVTASTTSLAISAFVLFIIFFVGAIASCVGACWAMACKRND